MIITDLDGNQYRWSQRRGKSKKASQLHLEAFQLVRKIYSCEQLIEEITIPLTKVRKVYGDIYITRLNKLIEVHGRQHYEHIPFYHKTIGEFKKAQHRDRQKKEWCEINDIQYVELPFDKIDKWEELIRS